jgi:hypothetical protein
MIDDLFIIPALVLIPLEVPMPNSFQRPMKCSYLSFPHFSLDPRQATISEQTLPTACFCKQSFIGTAMLIHLYIAYDSSHAVRAELKSCYQDQLAHKAKNIYHLAFSRKSVLTLPWPIASKGIYEYIIFCILFLSK